MVIILMVLCQQNLGTLGVFKLCEFSKDLFVIGMKLLASNFLLPLHMYVYSDMSFNNLSGSIPLELGQLQNLAAL